MTEQAQAGGVRRDEPVCSRAEPTLRHSKIAVTMEICTEIPSAAIREALRKPGQWLDS